MESGVNKEGTAPPAKATPTVAGSRGCWSATFGLSAALFILAVLGLLINDSTPKPPAAWLLAATFLIVAVVARRKLRPASIKTQEGPEEGSVSNISNEVEVRPAAGATTQMHADLSPGLGHVTLATLLDSLPAASYYGHARQSYAPPGYQGQQSGHARQQAAADIVPSASPAKKSSEATHPHLPSLESAGIGDIKSNAEPAPGSIVPQAPAIRVDGPFLPSSPSRTAGRDDSLFPVPRSITEVDRMDWRHFEHYVARLLERHNYRNVWVTPAQGDGGADIVAEYLGGRFSIQVKLWQKWRVDERAIDEALRGKARYGCEGAMVVTNAEVSTSARQYAKAKDCRIIERAQLTRWVEQYTQEVSGTASPPLSAVGYQPVTGDLRVGDLVRHPRFGEGRVESVQGRQASQEAVVQFRTAGTRRLAVRDARLERRDRAN